MPPRFFVAEVGQLQKPETVKHLPLRSAVSIHRTHLLRNNTAQTVNNTIFFCLHVILSSLALPAWAAVTVPQSDHVFPAEEGNSYAVISFLTLRAATSICNLLVSIGFRMLLLFRRQGSLNNSIKGNNSHSQNVSFIYTDNHLHLGR